MESMKQWVYRSLRQAIMTGRFPPGLPVTIQGIVEMLQVSAMPVHEALHRLVADGALNISTTAVSGYPISIRKNSTRSLLRDCP
ncbi:GntR family transcriptional regulator (plasmid) [Rhizobium sp. RCAM05350]|nr:GntR family transcriptional regulator [Rhizobium sp. RCAM05350]